jgi:predicted nucleic-acid-binding protein
VRAIDTNIVVRFLTADDPEQAKAARRVIEGGDIFVGTTVLLESEWVLRSGYGFQAGQIADGLAGLAGLPGIMVEEPAELAQALDWMREGLDFADALHLAQAAHCDAFVTFDRKLANRARQLGAMSVEVP